MSVNGFVVTTSKEHGREAVNVSTVYDSGLRMKTRNDVSNATKARLNDLMERYQVSVNISLDDGISVEIY